MRVVTAEREVHGPESLGFLGAQTNLASLYLSMGRPVAARNILVPTLEVKRRVLGIDHDFTQICMQHLGTALEGADNPAAALAIREELADWLIPHLRQAAECPEASSHDKGYYIWTLMTCAAVSRRDYATALRFAEELNEATGHQDSVNLDLLAMALARNDRLSEAIAMQHRAIERFAGDNPGLFAMLVDNLREYEELSGAGNLDAQPGGMR
jgi:hypothetical protein